MQALMQELFLQLAPDGLAALAPTLHLDRLPAGGHGLPSSQGPTALPREGWLELGEVAPADVCAALVALSERLEESGLPATTMYAFREVWALGERARAAVERATGCGYAFLDDAWAFRVVPGAAGWPPHRGIYQGLARDVPEVLNVWVALSDAPRERSCMWLVPLDADPAYPDDLPSVRPPADAGRPAPLRAGAALAWNANVLHWGGPCAPGAAGPRVSCTFTLVRPGTPLGDAGGRRVDPSRLDAAARLDLIARQVLVYGEGQPDVSPEVRAWARITANLASRFGEDT